MLKTFEFPIEYKIYILYIIIDLYVKIDEDEKNIYVHYEYKTEREVESLKKKLKDNLKFLKNSIITSIDIAKKI